MDVKLSDRGPVAVVAITGSIDSLNAEEVGSAIAAPIAAGRTQLVADFGGVNYTSSAGLRALLGAVKDCRRAGGDLRIAALQPSVERVLSIAGFTSIIKVYADVDAAVASFSAGAAG